ncbi:MAG: hypothetical protein K8R02_04530 [Anaerohalosphaeraceae bacterium]|nr:hypothetical protein [Anaerohalosphaeraceae bacterium]
MITNLITFCFSGVLLGLKPRQRWDAVRNTGGYDFNDGWLVFLGIGVAILLLSIILAKALRWYKPNGKSSNKIFLDYAKMRGLDDNQQHLLLEIAINSGLNRNESIFTLPTAFDRGVNQMTQQVYAEADFSLARQLQDDFLALRQKLGFGQMPSVLSTASSEKNNCSTVQIDTGRMIYLKSYDKPGEGDVEAKVVDSSDKGLAVKLTKPVEINFGRLWRGRYYSQAVVWEFDTAFTSCSGDVFVLAHSDNIRLINRRRFLRVPVQKPAYVASFPFARRFFKNFALRNKKSHPVEQSSQHLQDVLQPPQFVAAMVTELAGPGLVIDADLDVKVGERVLLVFKLGSEKSASGSSPRPRPEQIIEGTAVVRHVNRIDESSCKIAVEFTNLDDADVSELIRATNEASISLGGADGAKTAAVSEIALEQLPQEVEI